MSQYSYAPIAPAASAPLAGASDNADPCAKLLMSLLDEIDYGLMLMAGNGRVRVANRPARAECAAGGALRLVGGHLDAAHAADQTALAAALAQARQGRRTMLRVGRAAQAVQLAVVPLAASGDDDEPHALILIGKRQVCEALSVEFFARSHRLTTAEGNVLQALCNGLGPSVIAQQFGVAVSTIRTQVSSIRLKTEARSIRELVKQVTVLPPIVTALRSRPAATWH
jgi:DNA-binding CsgD family transcriptional regulator